jgi:hypothetical protein
MKFLKNFAFAFVVFLAGLTAFTCALAAFTYLFGPIGVLVGLVVLAAAAMAVGFAESEFAE